MSWAALRNRCNFVVFSLSFLCSKAFKMKYNEIQDFCHWLLLFIVPVHYNFLTGEKWQAKDIWFRLDLKNLFLHLRWIYGRKLTKVCTGCSFGLDNKHKDILKIKSFCLCADMGLLSRSQTRNRASDFYSKQMWIKTTWNYHSVHKKGIICRCLWQRYIFNEQCSQLWSFYHF